jgi:NAD(P)-dependent dehydrogenase (short-subunit alcohol dehydrogenase family)
LDPVAEGTSLGEANHGLWSYNASKASAIHLSKSLAATLGDKFITVNAICPGVYASRKLTAFGHGLYRDSLMIVLLGMTAYGLSQNKDHITNAYPMGRIGTPEDIAGLVIFLSSRAGAHISGSFIETDGKFTPLYIPSLALSWTYTGGALNAGRGYRKKAPESKL